MPAGPIAIGARVAIGIPLLVAAVAAATHWPIAPPAALALTAAGFAMALWQPAIALAIALALLPVLALAPWTGWLALEEIDLLLACLAAGGLLRGCLSARPPAPGRDAGQAAVPARRLALAGGLYALSWGLATLTGWLDAGPAPWHSTQAYLEPLNALRLAKPFGWALLLLPLLAELQRDRPDAFAASIEGGMLAGLILCGAAATWERMAFPGLLDFSSDYRSSALFWEMHVGGAALDGYLAMAMPFAVHAALRAVTPARLIVAGAAVAIGAYACLTTFSRGVYLAIPVGLGLMLLLEHRRHAMGHTLAPGRESHSRPWSLRATLIALAGASLLAWLVFLHGGYRATGAGLGALLTVVLAAPAARRLGAGRRCAALTAGALAGLALGVAAQVLPKGPYLAHGVACVAALAAVRRFRSGDAGTTQATRAFALAAAPLGGTIAVAVHWGGTPALPGAAAAMGTLALLAIVDSLRPHGLWPQEPRRALVAVGAMGIAAGCVAVFSGGSYMGTRFADSARDLEGRAAHWRTSPAMLDGTTAWLLGRGLGRWPAAYLEGRLPSERPGRHAWSSDHGSAHLALIGGGMPAGWGELYRVGQRVPAQRGLWLLRLDVLADAATRLQVEICEKHLLYSGACVTRVLALPPSSGRWRSVTVPLVGRDLGGGHPLIPRLAMFSIALVDPDARLAIDNLQLISPDGIERIRNPGFDAALTHWFFTSDHLHLPWHAKNLALHLLVEQGLLGLIGFTVLCAAGLGRLPGATTRAHPLAAPLAGSLTAFLSVGLFDSLLDIPRVAALFFMLIATALLLRKAGGDPLADHRRAAPD